MLDNKPKAISRYLGLMSPILSFVAIVGCSSSGGNSPKVEPDSQVISNLTIVNNLDGTLEISWSRSGGSDADVYYSSDVEFDVANYSAYDNAGYSPQAIPPISIDLSEREEEYAIKVVDTNGSEVLTKTVGTRFYIDEGGAVFFDAATNLYWNRCSLGQQWDGQSNSCVGAASELNRSEALLAVPISSESDWRFPSENELKSLWYCDSIQPNEQECISKSDYGNIVETLFKGSTLRAYFDDSILSPSTRDGAQFIRASTFYDSQGGVQVSVDPGISMHVITVRGPSA